MIHLSWVFVVALGIILIVLGCLTNVYFKPWKDIDHDTFGMTGCLRGVSVSLIVIGYLAMVCAAGQLR